MVYDPRLSRLILFGGWANRWFGDLYVCKVGEVVGPPYSIDSISPGFGPITGGTRCTITGIGFSSSGSQATVRFACMKGHQETSGEVRSDTEIVFDTPPFEKFGAVPVEGRVGVGGKSLTNAVIKYEYFTVTSCDTSLAFGPGILSGCIAGHPVSVVIQAKDSQGMNRICGMDFFTVSIATVTAKKDKELIEPVEGLEPVIADQTDGTHMVNWTYPSPGLYDVSVSFDGTFAGKQGHVRGSPFRVLVEADGDKVKNELTGPLMMKYVVDTTKNTKDYATKNLKELKKTIPKEEVDALIKVKEVLQDVEAQRKNLELSTDSNRSALQYLKSRGGAMDKQLEALELSSSLWADVSKQVPLTGNAIIPLTKNWSVIIEQEVEEYCKIMQQKLKDSKTAMFWDDSLTVEQARTALAEAATKLSAEKDALAQKASLTKTFEFPQLVKSAVEVVDEMILDITEMGKVWDVIEGLTTFVTESKNILWREMNTDDLDEGSKGQVKLVKNLHKNTRWCKAYKMADKMSKDFVNTVPLIALLGAKSMRPRHWQALMTTTKKQFVPPYEDKEMLLDGILALNLHEFSADVEDICDQAAKEMKIENTLAALTERWKAIEWLMDKY